MGYERYGSELWWVPSGMSLEGGTKLPEAQIGPFKSLPKGKAKPLPEPEPMTSKAES